MPEAALAVRKKRTDSKKGPFLGRFGRKTKVAGGKNITFFVFFLFFRSCDRQTMCLDHFSTPSGGGGPEMAGKMDDLGRSGCMKSKHGLERFRMKSLPSAGSGFFLGDGALQERRQVLRRGQTHPVIAQGFNHALVGPMARPQHQ